MSVYIMKKQNFNKHYIIIRVRKGRRSVNTHTLVQTNGSSKRGIANTRGKFTTIPSSVNIKYSSTSFPPHFSRTVAHKTTTEGTVVQGGASRVLGGRDEIRSQTATIERWVPPSAIKRDALPENSDDVKFRKVRSILNKLTPQTFDRLSDELIHVGLDSQSLLKGVILLIFEKALQEPKYVCMYAQLCKKLSKRVPNFDPPNPDQTTTFRRLLLLKCQDEYTNRARAYAEYDQRKDRLTPDEEEEKHSVKRKMLGNIKFIGELGKLEMLTHSILHRCCQELVKKTKAEDLECLCQIMSTCGHLLDNDKGKYLMDQYFARILELSKNDKLPSRIRFMLQDVLELRSNQWLQRQSVSVKESPKPIEDIRREAQEEFGLVDNRSTEDFRYIPIDSSKRGRPLGSRKMTGMEDVFAPFPIGVSSLGTGPGVITPGEKQLGQDTNGYHGGPMNTFRPPGGMRTYNNQQNIQGGVNHPFFTQHKNNKMNHNANQQQQYSNMNHQMRNNHNNMVNNGHAGYEKAPVAPRFRKGNNGSPNMNGGALAISPLPNVSKEELSLRPPPNSMIKMFPQAQKPSIYGSSFNDTSKSTLPKLSPPRIVSPKETALADAAKTTIEKPKPKKEKGPTKDEIAKKVDGILENYKGNNNIEEAIDAFKRMEIQEKFIGTALISALNKALDCNESDRELVYGLMLQLVESEVITQNQFLDAFRSMLDLMIDLEADIPRIKSYVASLAARAICQKKLTLSDVGDSTENGNHYPFLLLVLQQLSKVIDKAELCKMFEESKIQMINTLPKIDRTKDRMTEILEERELSFLFPLLKIQTEMTKQLQTNPSAADFAVWIKERVDPAHRTAHGFISSLVSVIFKYIIQEVSKNQTDQTEKAIRDSERALLSSFKPIISEYLSERVDLQVIAIYALQSSWFSMDCPKVMLLRWFVNMYELEIIDEDAFLKWKEDIRDDYPGKGNALFQVNQWLLWLEQVDEEEDGDDEQDN